MQPVASLLSVRQRRYLGVQQQQLVPQRPKFHGRPIPRKMLGVDSRQMHEQPDRNPANQALGKSSTRHFTSMHHHQEVRHSYCTQRCCTVHHFFTHTLSFAPRDRALRAIVSTTLSTSVNHSQHQRWYNLVCCPARCIFATSACSSINTIMQV